MTIKLCECKTIGRNSYVFLNLCSPNGNYLIFSIYIDNLLHIDLRVNLVRIA